MEREVSLEDLSKISYFEIKRIDDRDIPLQACFNENSEWEMWLSGPGGLVKMQSMEPVEGHYFAKKRVSKADGYLFFSDYMLKHAYYPEVAYSIQAILDDLLNLGASIEKLELFFIDWLKGDSKVSGRFVSTELEYIFNACRSIFDLLQQIICKLWDRIQLIDEEENAKKKHLPSSFTRMVLTDNTLLSQDEIQKKHAIPSRVAKFYFQQGHFFKWLRDYRDHVLHHGKNFDLIFLTEQGFAVSLSREPFSSLYIWNQQNTMPKDLGSVRAAISHVISKTVTALEEFALLLKQTIKLPYDIAPNYNVFVRGPNCEVLLKLESYLTTEAWHNGH